METDLWLLFLRLGVVAVLYLFLLQLVLVLRRSLSAGEQVAAGAVEAARLVVVESGTPSLLRGQTFVIQGVASIGRSPTCAVKIEDPFVSAEHAVISLRDGHLWIEDLGSTNGTFVNRRQIAGPTPLQPGDVVQVGQVKLKLLR